MIDSIINFLWRIDYPLSITLSFLTFFICFPKKKHFYIPLIIGLGIIFGFWQFIAFPIFSDFNGMVLILYAGEIIALFVLIYMSLDVDWTSALFILTASVTLQHLSYCVCQTITDAIGTNIKGQLYYFAISYGILILMCVLAYIIFARQLSKYCFYINKKSIGIAFIFVFLIEFVLSYIDANIISKLVDNRLAISLCLNISNILLTLAIIVLLYYITVYEQQKQENIALSMIKIKDSERFEMAKVSIDEINIKYHDLKHALKNNDLNEYDRKEIETTVTNYKAFVHTNNQGLNVAIYESQLKCIKNNIDLNVLLDGDVLENFKPNHIYSMLSNLLDNSIEATLSLSDKEKKKISLSIKKVRNNIVITVENYTKDKTQLINGLPSTSKKDKFNHGYGLRSVKNIVERYNGILNITRKNEQFIVKIVFPYSSKGA